jgi:N-acetylglucosaminyldiphosphoundecaprenol N-acetyl-beta-D-mannosaminyltransferase
MTGEPVSHASESRRAPTTDESAGRRRAEILGYTVWCASVRDLVGEVLGWIEAGEECRWAGCLNPHSYAVASRDTAFRDALLGADWLLPDGVGIVLAARLLGRPLDGRVTGTDLFEELHGRASELKRPLRVYLLGSTDHTLARVSERLVREHPDVQVAGVHSPPFAVSFTPEQDQLMVEAVNRARADVLWVSMTAPKQELWLARNRHRLNVSFAGAVGAVFDFYTGKIPRSHPLARRMGLEWLPRLIREPRRLWRRTFVSAPLFLWDLARAKARARAESRGRV